MSQYDRAALGCIFYLGWQIGDLRRRVAALEEILKREVRRR